MNLSKSLYKKAEKLKLGDPMSKDTDIGPLVNEQGLKNIESIVNESIKEGAELLTGGERSGTSGYFYRPTIIKNVSPKMRISKEEVFGPVDWVLTVNDEDEGIRLANDTQYGLGASIWTQDLEKAEKLSRKVSSGIVSVNNVVASDPQSTIWRCKESGLWKRAIKIWNARVC